MKFITNKQELNLEGLRKLTRKPPIFARDTINFWQDPYISDHLLYAHLDEDTDQGSRKYTTIMESVSWISKYLNLPKGSKLLDLGCGPGLYSSLFHKQGFNVTGIDFSESSIKHAIEVARENQHSIEYICQDYLKIDYTDQYDVVTLIYGDLCVLSNQERSTILNKIWKALKPGGYIVCDVFTKRYINSNESDKSWFISMEEGFWKPGQHFVLQQHFKYKKEKVYLDKYTIIEKDGTMQTYHIWKHFFSSKRICCTLSSHGFEIMDLFGDLCGAPLEKGSKWIGVVARKI